MAGIFAYAISMHVSPLILFLHRECRANFHRVGFSVRNHNTTFGPSGENILIRTSMAVVAILNLPYLEV